MQLETLKVVFKSRSLKKVKIITIDFLNIQKNNSIPKEIDVVYYLIHSMSSKIDGFSKMEIDCAKTSIT